MDLIPHEIALGGIYVPPMMLAGLVGTLLAVWVARLLNKYRLSRFLFYPPLVFVSMTVIFTVLVGTLIIPG